MRSTAMAVLVLLGACQHSDVSRALGARCTTADDCDDLCLPGDTPGMEPWPGGFCTRTCAMASDCPGDTTCAGREGGVCLFTCGADADCEFLGDRWGCHDDDLHGGGIKVKVCRGS